MLSASRLEHVPEREHSFHGVREEIAVGGDNNESLTLCHEEGCEGLPRHLAILGVEELLHGFQIGSDHSHHGVILRAELTHLTIGNLELLNVNDVNLPQ